MNYSHIQAHRVLAVLLLVASLAVTGAAMATERFSPLELERLRMVSRALLEARATERQRVLHDSADQRLVLADVDSRLRALEAAVMEDQLPRTHDAPKSSMSASAAQARRAFTNINATRSEQVAPAPASGTDRSRGALNPAPTEPGTQVNSTATVALIDAALASVSVHRRTLSKRPNKRGATALPPTARIIMPRAAAAHAPASNAQDRLTEALSVVDAALRGMRVRGGDLQGLRRVREKISLAAPPTRREISPTFQTITKHYR